MKPNTPHGRVNVEQIKDAATREALRQMNDNIEYLKRKIIELENVR